MRHKNPKTNPVMLIPFGLVFIIAILISCSERTALNDEDAWKRTVDFFQRTLK